MSPIISPSGRRVCYNCGRKTEVLMTVDMPGVPHAELCSNCLCELALWMDKKEEELKDDDKKF